MRGFFNEHLTYGTEGERKLEVRINPENRSAIFRDFRKYKKSISCFLFHLLVFRNIHKIL